MRALALIWRYCLVLICFAKANAQYPSEIEYFIDTDPGYGNGSTLNYLPNSSGEMAFGIDITSSSNGIHQLFIRAQDSNGNWSITHAKVFIKEEFSNSTGLSEIEYFIDDDPGFGNGNKLTHSTDGEGNMIFDINIASLQKGLHILKIRVKDNLGNWSITHLKPFYIESQLFNDANITDIEYFIGEDPGVGSGTPLSFIADPNLKTVVANFDIPISALAAGENIISVRAKNSEGDWGSLHKYKYQRNAVVNIFSPPDNVNQKSYFAPKESIIHIYYQAIDTLSATPLKGVQINYALDNAPEIIHTSRLSDDDGLIDLYITPGGEDSLSTNDDWLEYGNVKPIFKSLTFGKIGNTNEFDETINILLQTHLYVPQEIKNTFKFKFDNNYANVNDSKLKVRAGINSNLRIEYEIDKINPNIWHISSNLDLLLKGSLDYNFLEKSYLNKEDVNKNKIPYSSKLVEVNIDGELGAKVGPNIGLNFDLDLSKAADVFFVAAGILLREPNLSPLSLRLSNSFKKLSKCINSDFQNPFNYSGFQFGAGFDFKGGGAATIKFPENDVSNLNGYAKVLKEGFELGLSADFNYGIDAQFNFTEYEGRKGRFFTLNNSFSYGIESKFDFFSRLTRRADLDFWKITIPTKIYSNAKSYNLSLTNYITSKRDNISKVDPIFAKFDVSSSKEISVLETSSEEVEIKNSWEFDGNAISRAMIDANLLETAVYNSPLVEFMYSNRYRGILNGTNNGLEDILILQKHLVKTKDVSFLNSSIKNYSNKEYKYNEVYPMIELPLLKAKKFDFAFEAGTTFDYRISDSKFSKTLGRVLPTIEHRILDNFYQRPDNTKLGLFWSTLSEHISNQALDIIYCSLDFINDISVKKINQVLVLGNGGEGGGSFGKNIVRKGLNSQVLFDKSNKTTKETDADPVPSVMTFTVNPSPEIFSINTAIDFNYFYPENLLSAITVDDTFRILSDVFSIQAVENEIILDSARNGYFIINSIFSPHDLRIASLPVELVPKVLFKSNKSKLWKVIGDVNSTIPFNNLGEFAIGISLEIDTIPPNILVTYPDSLKKDRKILVQLNDNSSGIDWNNTSVLINNLIYPFKRIGITDSFEIKIDSINFDTTGTYNINIITYDLVQNVSQYKETYPCEYSFQYSKTLDFDDPILKERASRDIEIVTKFPEGKMIEFTAGKNILLSPGFEVKNGKSFKAEIKGCLEP